MKRIMWRRGKGFDLFTTLNGRVLKVSADDEGWWFRPAKKDSKLAYNDYASPEAAKRACIRYWKNHLAHTCKPAATGKEG